MANVVVVGSPGRDPEEEKRMGLFCDCAIPRTRGPAPLLATPREPSERARFERLGAMVFARDCSGCHGPAGKGDGPAAVSLLPRPRDLSGARFAAPELAEWGSSAPVEGASLSKILAHYALHQLCFDLENLIQSKSVKTAAELEKAAKAHWAKAGWSLKSSGSRNLDGTVGRVNSSPSCCSML